MRTPAIACALALIATPVLGQPLQPTLPGKGLEPGTVLTMPILIEGPAVKEGSVADAPTEVTLTLKRLKPGSRAAVTSLNAPAAACRFVPAPGAASPGANADSSGTAVLKVKGLFASTGAATGPCTFKATLSAVRSDGDAQQPSVESSRVTLAAPTVYVLANTADWAPKFTFRNTAAAGDCTGSSSAIGGGIFRVGLVTSEGGQAMPDITLRVRSGPAGTHCTWKSDAILLPQGVKLTEMVITVASNGRCTARLNGFAGGKFTGAGFRSDANPIATPAGETVAANPGGAGNPVYGVLPLTVQLDCDGTVTNDRFANLTIDSMTFTGPASLSFP